MEGLLMARVSPAGFAPTELEERYARLLLSDGAPTDVGEVAARLHVTADVVAGLADRPGFREWLQVRLERGQEPLAAALWRGVYRDATEAMDPKVRLEAARMWLGRWDPASRVGDRDVGEAVKAFGRRLAGELAKRPAGRRV